MEKKYFLMAMKGILAVLSLVFGGSMAMAVDAPDAGNYGGDSDPNAGNPLEGGMKTLPEDKGGIAQHYNGGLAGKGADANASALQEAGLLNNKLTRQVIEYRANQHSLFAAIHSKPTQMSWKGHKEAEYPEVGEIKTEARTKGAITGGTETVTITSAQLHSNDLSIFRKDYTIFVMGQEGYDEGETTNTNGEILQLYVTDVTNTSFTVMAINGPALSSGSKKTKVPTIEEGTVLSLAAPALAEEEVEVDPINILPTMKAAFLQKKGYSVAITDFFNEAVKEVDWEANRIKRQALDTYKDLYTKTVLFGSKKKFYKKNKNGVRICYTQDGLLNQVRMSFQLPGDKWTKGALIGIAKMLFTTYTDADEIDVFCGSDAIEGLLNIDWGKDVSQIVYMKDSDYNLDIATFNCTFGKLKFIHELALTKNGLSKAAIAIPMKDAIRIYRDNGKTLTVDGKKGETGNVEELVKDYFIEDDALICNAMNTMLIGTASVFGQPYGAVAEKYKAVEALPGTATTGDIYYLTVADDTHGTGLWKKTETGWDEYTRDQTKA